MHDVIHYAVQRLFVVYITETLLNVSIALQKSPHWCGNATMNWF